MVTRNTRDLVTDKCNRQCTFWHQKMTRAAFDQFEVWIQEGQAVEQICERMKAVFDFDCTPRTLHRHISKHMHQPEVDEDISSGNLTDLQVLEAMIKTGAKNLRSDSKIRITPEMTVRAIELKYKLTQGNVFESFLGGMADLMEEATGRGDDPSVQSKDEAAQATEE
jgi:hypothetical protein